MTTRLESKSSRMKEPSATDHQEMGLTYQTIALVGPA
jgi:hypothetical protein